MSSFVPQRPEDPVGSYNPSDTIGQWTEPSAGEAGFPPEVPRHPAYQQPEWSPQSPQEAPLRRPTIMPDWSPSSATDPPLVEEPENPTKHDSPARPPGKHDLGDTPDKRTGPTVVEDPPPGGQSAEEGGDIEAPGSQNPSVFELDDR